MTTSSDASKAARALGKRSAAARKKALGEKGFRTRMKELGKLGGRPRKESIQGNDRGAQPKSLTRRSPKGINTVDREGAD